MMRDALKRCCTTHAPSSEKTDQPCCAPAEPSRARERAEERGELPKLEDLIPIAVVVTAGCEACADRMVRRAVEAGSAARHVLRTIAIVADLRERDCFRTNIAPEVVERMQAPLARARKTLGELTSPRAAAAGAR